MDRWHSMLFLYSGKYPLKIVVNLNLKSVFSYAYKKKNYKFIYNYTYMSRKAMSLKAKIRNLAKEKDISAQVILQNYMFERFLERLSKSY